MRPLFCPPRACVSVLAGILLAVCVVHPLGAQTSQRVSVTAGQSKTVSGTIVGKAYADYRVPLGAGQSIQVELKSGDNSVNFNVNPPKSNVSLYIGSIDGTAMKARMVPSDGEYIVRVYQLGASASEGKSNKFQLRIAVTGRPLKALSGRQDARISGTPYHASAPVPAMVSMQPQIKGCTAYVVRRGSGSATVEFKAGSMVRRVLFVNGVPKAHDSHEKMTHKRDGDTTILKFGAEPSEQFSVPDALIYGG